MFKRRCPARRTTGMRCHRSKGHGGMCYSRRRGDIQGCHWLADAVWITIDEPLS